jgi:hypothetical protein
MAALDATAPDDEFFSTLIRGIRGWWNILKNLLYYIIAALPLVILLLIAVGIGYLASNYADGSIAAADTGLRVSTRVYGVVQPVYNSVALITPLVANIWNFGFLLVQTVFETLRLLVCPGGWPPRDIQSDCPLLYGAIDLAFSLVGLVKTFFELSWTFFEALGEVLEAIICATLPVGQECDRAFFVLLQYLYDFLVWIVGTLLPDILDAIKWFFYSIADASDIPGDLQSMQDIRDVWQIMVNDLDQLRKAFVRFVMNLTLTVPDYWICSLIWRPLPCSAAKLCRAIFSQTACVPIPIVCSDIFTQLFNTTCPCVQLTLTSVCDIFDNSNGCPCE